MIDAAPGTLRCVRADGPLRVVAPALVRLGEGVRRVRGQLE